MLQQLGQQIRRLREQKGKTLNEFAKELNVSSGYLSNLETGKSETIKLVVLERIQKELKVLPLEASSSFSKRIKRIEQHIADLERKNPALAEFIIQNTENNLDWILDYYKEKL